MSSGYNRMTDNGKQQSLNNQHGGGGGPQSTSPAPQSMDNMTQDSSSGTSATSTTANSKGSRASVRDGVETHFQESVGQLPFCDANVRNGREAEDLVQIINHDQAQQTPMIIKGPLSALVCATGVGCCYLMAKQILIKDGCYGFVRNNQRIEILMPGRHLLASPFNAHIKTVSVGDDVISVPPVSIIRVAKGEFGFALDNGRPQILMPGVHVRKSAAFKFMFLKPATNELIEFGPIKMLTVQSGTVRVCFAEGRVQIYQEGRFAFNSGTFAVDRIISTRQQNIRFTKHTVLLDGGISMLVEGLLTYQIVNVSKLINNLGAEDLMRSLQDVTKAELSRVFASIHLEQISTTQIEGQPDATKTAAVTGKVNDSSSSSSSSQNDVDGIETHGGENANKVVTPKTNRMAICERVVQYITPLVESWGVSVINFQLESTKLADQKYAQEYEEASLKMAKAKANRRALQMENEIRLQTARAVADTLKIEAEGQKAAVIIRAEGDAEARTIEAGSRNTAAAAMTDPFAQQFAIQQQQVEFARALKAQVLTVGENSSLGQAFMGQAMLKK